MSDDPAEELVLPLVEERLRVEKRAVDTGRVRVSLRTETVEELVRETLRGRRADVQRVPVGRQVDDVPAVREEGGVMIIPVVEEVLVVEKRLVLREELHLRFVDEERVAEQRVERRVQHAVVERVPPETAE